MLWIPFLQELGKGSLYGYLQLVQSLLAPSIAAVFMLGIFSKFVSPISGLVGIITGFVLGMGRLLLVVASDEAAKNGGDLGALQSFVDLNWLYFSFLLFVFTCAVIFLTSMVTPKAPPEKLAGLTYGSVTTADIAENKSSYGFWEIFHTVVILAIIAGIYIYFW
jgi:solute:Na+ symporter, SSS family